MEDQACPGVRVYKPTRRERSAFVRRRHGPFVLAFGLIGLAVAGALRLILGQSLAMAKDVEGMPVREGVGTVVVAAWTPMERFPGAARPVELAFNGTFVWVNSAFPFYAHQRAAIHYCIGRTGRIYVLSAMPTPTR